MRSRRRTLPSRSRNRPAALAARPIGVVEAVVRRPGSRRSDGQVLMLFAIGLVAILGFGSLGFDVGRFYTERRYLQNAADAGALAVGSALARGLSDADAIAEGQAVVVRNIANSPTGSGAAAPVDPPVYEDGHAGDPLYMIDGIRIDGNYVRVAVRGTSRWTLGSALGLGSVPIIAQAKAQLIGDLLPVAIRRYINPPGPNSGATAPCNLSGNPHEFVATIATADTACLGTSTDGSLRTPPSAGTTTYDPSVHGPVQTMVGVNAKPNNAADFRGFVALDIRNFSAIGSNVFYNGVTAGTQATVLKDLEASWVSRGYPGPGFPPVVSPPDPALQVGLLDGNSSGLVLDAMNKRFRAGDEVLVASYSGTVMAIPDFTIQTPNTVSIGTTQDRANAVTMTVSKNSAFAGTVDVSAFKDWGDAQNPYGTTMSALTFSPNPITPNGTVTWTTFNTTGAPVGIYTIWIQGHSGSPYLTDHYFPVGINVGGVQRDFTASASGLDFLTETTGGTATGSFTLSTPNQNSSAFEGTVNLSIEGGAEDNGVLPTGIGARSLTPNVTTLPRGTTRTISVSINAGTLAPGVYPLTIAIWGNNSAGQKVTRLYPITLSVAVGSTQSEYIDIDGFVVYRITKTTSNELEGYAITNTYDDVNDPQLRRGQTPRLVPWN